MIHQARRRHTGEEARASFMELFFDLVFVLVVTQLSALLLDEPTVLGAAKMFFLLLIAWWAWVYTTWTTNWFDPDTVAVRFVLLIAMVASMLGAIAIPDAFGDRALLLVVGYVGLNVVRNTFVLVATPPDEPLYLPLGGGRVAARFESLRGADQSLRDHRARRVDHRDRTGRVDRRADRAAALSAARGDLHHRGVLVALLRLPRGSRTREARDGR